MSDLVAPPPASCPGTSSSNAGIAESCKGCPNAQICASAPKGPDPDIAVLVEKMASLDSVILVLSGKGGVGKSTLSVSLAREASAHFSTGLLDIDICGPSVPRLIGSPPGTSIHTSAQGWEPVWCSDSLAVMSIGYLLASETDAVVWRAGKKNGLIKQFLRDVNWSDTSVLFVDTPPGTSDEHLSIVQYVRASGKLKGAILVTTPQEVALQDVRKQINFCAKVQCPVLGVIENMAGFVCGKCGTQSSVFAPTTGGAQAMCTAMGVPYLGAVPLDPAVAQACDAGQAFITASAGSPAAAAVRGIFDQVAAQVLTATPRLEPL